MTPKGRPQKEDPNDVKRLKLDVRFSPNEIEEFKNASKTAEVNFSAWVRKALQNAME